jgi:hypothetical protein
VHAPGTILNDQFKGPDAWEAYLKAVETATPVIRAIGVTDYYSTESYERVCEAKRLNRLQNCDLIFPNIEMRLDWNRQGPLGECSPACQSRESRSPK